MIVFGHDRYSKVRLSFVSSMESLSWILWFCNDFNDSDNSGILANRMVPSWGSYSRLCWISSSGCIPRGCSIVSGWIYPCSICRSGCHHSCVRQISQSVSYNWIPIVDSWPVKHKSRAKLFLCFLEDSLFVVWMIKHNIFSEIAGWHYFISSFQKLNSKSICTY